MAHPHSRWPRALVASLLALPPAAIAQTQFQSYVTGLSSPIGIVNAGDGSNRLFVNQQTGAARVINASGATGTLLGPNYFLLDASTQCSLTNGGPLSVVGFSNGSERGFLGLAFHPDFASNGRVFVSFTDVNGDNIIARFTAASPTANVLSAADLATCQVLLRVDQDGANHNGGHILFGPDGFLYVAMGDGGGGGASPGDFGGGDTCNRGQTLNPANLSATSNCASDANFTGNGGNANSRALLGKMLRLNVDASTAAGAGTNLCGSLPDGSANYAVPANNPFLNDNGTTAACDEVWAYGLRNPWRSSFDLMTGDLFIGDVGQSAVEEIDFQLFTSTGGTNYGWRCFEGNSTHASCIPALTDHAPPVITYSHASGRCSVTGGYRYRGPVLDVQGRYFYGDYCTGEVWTSIQTGSNWSAPGTPPFQNFTGTLPSFGEDEIGNLYAVNGNAIWRLNGATTSANLALSMSGPASVVPGNNVVYTLTLGNSGPTDAATVSVANATPAGLTFVSNTGDCTTAFPCAFPTLPNGATRTITTTYTVPAGYAGASPIVNTASASSATPDPANGNNSATVNTTVTVQADVSVGASGPASVIAGSNVVYTITVGNAGPSSATNVSVADATPAGLTFVSNSGDCTTAFPCALGTLASGATRTITATFTVPSGYAGANPIANTVSVSSTTADPATGNNTSVVTTPFITIADLAITAAGPAGVALGQNVIYTITVSNNGPSDSPALLVENTTPPGLAFVANSGDCTTAFPCMLTNLVSGGTRTITSTFLVPANYVGPDPIANTFTATTTVGIDGSNDDPVAGNNDAVASTTLLGSGIFADGFE